MEHIPELILSKLKKFTEYISDIIVNISDTDQNSQTFCRLLIDFQHLQQFDKDLAAWIQNNYLEYLHLLRSISLNHIKKTFTNVSTVNVCFTNVPDLVKIHELRSTHSSKLISTWGRCIGVSKENLQVVDAVYQCNMCDLKITTPTFSNKYLDLKCRNCNYVKQFEFMSGKSNYIDQRCVTIQAVTSDLSQQVAQQIIVTLQYSKTMDISLGKNYKFFGTLCPKINRHSTRTPDKEDYQYSFLATHIEENRQENLNQTTPTDLIIVKMKNDPNLLENVIETMFPNFFGFDQVKFALLLQAIGGVSKVTQDGMPLRGDIHLLLIGDPSIGKSVLMNSIKNYWDIVQHCVGLGSTNAGLTAGIVTNPETGENEICPGAMAIANNGLCVIDEFDKLYTTNLYILHEAMEQQTISINKAGKQAEFVSKTSVLAAGNPIQGCIDSSLRIQQNMRIEAPLLSRFDLIFAMQDQCIDSADIAIATKIVEGRCNKNNINVPFTNLDVRCYILYCKQQRPTLPKETTSFIASEYMKIFKETHCTSRTLESIIRMSEAFAKFELEDSVSVRHVKTVIGLLQNSYEYISVN